MDIGIDTRIDIDTDVDVATDRDRDTQRDSCFWVYAHTYTLYHSGCAPRSFLLSLFGCWFLGLVCLVLRV